MTPELLVLIAAGVPSAVIGALGWFARNAFADIKTGLANLTVLVTALDKGSAVLEQRLVALEARVALLEKGRAP